MPSKLFEIELTICMNVDLALNNLKVDMPKHNQPTNQLTNQDYRSG